MSAGLARIRLETALTHPEVRERHRDREVRIWSGEHGLYWRPDRAGYTAHHAEAGVYLFQDAYQATAHCGREKRIQFEPVQARHARRDVRNPILAMTEVMEAITAASPEVRTLLAAILKPLARECARRAQEKWKANKAPMAYYYKVVGVYAKHLARAVRP